jgi:hypothetical protein
MTYNEDTSFLLNDTDFSTGDIQNYYEQNNATQEVVSSEVQSLDMLGRDKGHPVFSFVFGGRLLTSMPKKQTLYSTGQDNTTQSTIKTFPGPLRILDASTYISKQVLNEIETYFSHGPICPGMKPKFQALVASIDELIDKSNRADASLFIVLQYFKKVILAEKYGIS